MYTDIETILDEIRSRLVPAGIDRLILFGSYASGTPTDDSDIDLLVVTSDNYIPRTFAEKANLDITISHLIDHIRAQIPVDLIVHTKAMHRKFIEMNSLFCREILSKGRVLYESH
jgi:predicted nucleotidyltransferase